MPVVNISSRSRNTLEYRQILECSHLMGSVSNMVHLGELTAASTAPFSLRRPLNFLSSSTVSWRWILGANLSLSLTHLHGEVWDMKETRRTELSTGLQFHSALYRSPLLWTPSSWRSLLALLQFRIYEYTMLKGCLNKVDVKVGHLPTKINHIQWAALQIFGIPKLVGAFSWHW